MAEKDDRAARLAQKLRENLRKRKAQTRGTTDACDPVPPSGGSTDREPD
jgi:hypothetical protein